MSRRRAAGGETSASQDGRFTFVWKPRGGLGFNRTLEAMIQNYYFQLGCDRGDEDYWNSVRKEATQDPAHDGPQPFEYAVLMTLVETEAVVGFCLLRRGKLCVVSPQGDSSVVCTYPANSWYVEFICTARGQGHGRVFMNELHRRATELGKEHITLSALPEVIMFYHHMGYKLTLDLNCVEAPEISAVALQVRLEIARRKADGLKIPANVDEMLAEAPFSELVLASLRQNLSVTKLRGEDCKTRRECAEDGIYMAICLPRRRMEVVPDQSPTNTPPGRSEALRGVFEQLPVSKKFRALENNPDFMQIIGAP